MELDKERGYLSAGTLTSRRKPDIADAHFLQSRKSVLHPLIVLSVRWAIPLEALQHRVVLGGLVIFTHLEQR